MDEQRKMISASTKEIPLGHGPTFRQAWLRHASMPCDLAHMLGVHFFQFRRDDMLQVTRESYHWRHDGE